MLATVEPMEGLAEVRSWRLLCWRSAPEGAVPRLAALLDVLVGWLTMHHLTPNAFLQALWSAARQVIPQPCPIDHVLHDLRTRSHPRTAEGIADLQALLSDTGARLRQERPDQVLRQTSITFATRSALHRPSKPLAPYSRIQPDRGVELPTATAWLAEVTEQALATTRHRRHTMDIDFLTSAYDPQKWTPFFDPHKLFDRLVGFTSRWFCTQETLKIGAKSQIQINQMNMFRASRPSSAVRVQTDKPLQGIPPKKWE